MGRTLTVREREVRTAAMFVACCWTVAIFAVAFMVALMIMAFRNWNMRNGVAAVCEKSIEVCAAIAAGGVR